MRLFYSLLLVVLSFAVQSQQGFRTFSQLATLATPATIVHTTVDVAASSPANIFIYEPEGIENAPSNGWPLLLFYGGDGTDNNATTTVTNQAMTTSDNLTYTAIATNSGNNRILSNSVVIKDDGVEIARGRIGGTVVGANITSGSAELTDFTRAQVNTVTLTGTSGTANITGTGGLTKLVTFNTSLTQTAADFDATWSADYTAQGITVTSSGVTIIFTAATAGVPFTAPVITNATGDLAGSSVQTTANSTCTITFTSSTSLSGSITADYIHSAMFIEGIPFTMNQGEDFDGRGIVVSVQNRGNDADLVAGYLTEIIEYIWLNYTIDPKRINATGLSRGANQIGHASRAISINTYHTFWINESTGVVSTTDLGAGYVSSGYSSISLATMFIGGSYTNIANFSKIGSAGVMGTNDAFGNPMPSMAATWGANTTFWEFPYMYNIWNGTHSATAWHTNFYYRKYGSIGGGTAEWDYVDFAWKYSKDDEACATLFVEQAEKRREGDEHDIFDYREAVRKVSQLSAGAVKTALEARLATLKTTLDSEIEWRVIINHTTAAITASGNINNQTTHVDNARVDDLVDDNGNTLTGIDWFIGNNPLTSSYEGEFGSSRGYHNVAGFETSVNRAGMRISSTVCPVGFAGLPAGTYTLRIYHNESAGSFTNIELTATIGGVTKTGYSQYNRMVGYLEWTGLDETDLANFDIGRNTGDTYVTAVELIRVN